jgi:hypothetical protein
MCDGLYRVTTSYLCGGFVVFDGQVVDCAPVLRKRIECWMRLAIGVGP